MPARREAAIAAATLLVILACSALIVVAAADRPSLLVATSRAHFFPGWMAGPLGGIWPGLTRNGTALKYLFTFSLVGMYASYLLALAYVPALRVRWVIAAVVAVHVIFLLSPPLALTDVFNYINYGRMEVVHNLNPYTTIPILEPHSDPSFDLSNWHQLLSPYGPLFTLITFALVPLGVAASFWVMKVVLITASLLTIMLVWKCARMLDRDPVRAIVFVGMNPVVLVWGLGADHNDFLMMFCIVLAFYLLLRGRAAESRPTTVPPPGDATRGARASDHGEERAGPTFTSARIELERLVWWLRGWCSQLRIPEIGAGAALVTAAAIKASGGIVIPVVLIGMLRAPRRLVSIVLGMAVAGAVLGTVSLIAFGPHLPDLGTQGSLVTNVSVPNLLGLALGSGGETSTLRALLSGVLVLVVLLCGVLAWRRRELLAFAGWSTVALLLTLSWVLPWYVLWVLPLAALSRSRRLRIAALALSAYLIVAWAPASGLLWNAVGFHPEKTSLGRLHQRNVKELLN